MAERLSQKRIWLRYGQAAIVPVLATLLMGCQVPVRTKIKRIEVPVQVLVPVPMKLTTPLPIEEPNNPSVGECVRVARVRKAAIERCNAKLKAIRGLGE